MRKAQIACMVEEVEYIRQMLDIRLLPEKIGYPDEPFAIPYYCTQQGQGKWRQSTQHTENGFLKGKRNSRAVKGRKRKETVLGTIPTSLKKLKKP